MKPLCIDLFCGLGGWAEGFLAGNGEGGMTRSTWHLLLSPALAALVQAGMRIGLFDLKRSEPVDEANIYEPQQQSEHWRCSVCLKLLS